MSGFEKIEGARPVFLVLLSQMGRGKRWGFCWLTNSLKRKMMMETSLTEHLPCVGGHCGRSFLHFIGYAGIISIS